ncbi:TetR/AcrR family transcriptional regulator [Pseudolysinimonas sp.]|uniref:TetR/AcrR family transcriptional regulator n=1 Tax=Pseudolysinimonas sp. TaxID=2680009 RepID=UPI00286B84EA|nr:TetR/AcrR family transcriptional regulator [Pseudolysinimonas sp.]
MNPRRRAQRAVLSRDRVLAAAVELADEHGLDAVSMRRVGVSLGVEAMSLYRHVHNKDDLLDGMVDDVIARFPARDEAVGWRESLRGLVRGAHSVLLAHPWAAGLATSRPAVGPARLRFVDAVIGTLLAGGCSPQLAHDAMHAVEVHVFAFTLQELRLQVGPSAHGYPLDELLSGAGAAAYPHLAATLAVAEHDHVAEFEFVLELLIVGIERAISTSVGG